MTVAELRSIIATAVGRVDVPAGTYPLDYPLRLPAGVDLAGAGPRATTFEPAPHTYTPLVMVVNPALDTAPIEADGLRVQPVGWMSLFDYLKPDESNAAWTFDLELTLDSLAEGSLVSASAQFDDRTVETPFLLRVQVEGSLYLTVGGVRYASAAGVVPVGERFRITAQVGNGRADVWVTRASGTTHVLGQTVPAVGWPWYCDPCMGHAPCRVPEGAGYEYPPPGAVYHRVQMVMFPLGYSATNPPSGVTVQDSMGGFWSDFAEPDGCLFRGRVSGHPAVCIWRAGTLDGSRTVRLSGFGCVGHERSPAGVWLSGVHEWSAPDVLAANCRYGLILHSQCYGGEIRSPHAGQCRVGIALCNNSAITTIINPHCEANTVGILSADSDQLTVIGGWSDNNRDGNLLVKGDQSAVTCVGSAFGFESAAATRNVALYDLSSATFLGCAFTALTDAPMPAVEVTRSAGVSLTGPRFGVHTDADCVIRVVDGPTPTVTAEGKRWQGVGVNLFG